MSATAAYSLVPSPREQAVLELLAEGLTYDEIAAKLGIAHRTVEMHRDGLCSKFGATNVAMLMVLATRQGYIPEDGSYCVTVSRCA